MKNKKTIIYVDRENELQTCRNFLGSNPGEDIRCIVANSASKERLESWEIPCTPIVRYQVLQEQVEALPIAINLAGKWFYNSAGNDLTKFKGISLGGAMKYLVHLMLKYAIKAINNVNHILDQEQPDRIVLVENTNVEGHPPLFLDFDFYKIVFKWFAIQKGFEIKYLPIQNGGENSSYKNPWLEWQSLRLPGPVQNLSIFLPNPIISFSKSLFVNLVDGFKMFPFLNPNLDSGRIRALVLSATDLTYLGKFLIDQILKTKPNSIFYLEGEGNSYLNLRIRHANEPPSINLKGDPELSQFILKLDQVLETLKVNLNDNPQMKHRGVPLFSLSPQFFERIVCQEIANLAIFLVKANKAISNSKTNLILTTNHLMPKTVVLSQLASQKKIPSINIYHGHCYGFIDPHGKNFLNHQLVPRNFPYYFSYDIVGTQTNKILLEENGVKPENIILGGMGGFEKKPNASKMLKTKLCQELEIKPLWTLLFPASVTDDYTDRFCTPYFLDGFGTFQLYRELIHLFHGNSQRQLAIKFKPRDSLMELTQNLISSLAPGHAMIFTKNLHWLLNACDAVFIYHSNVGLEALFYDIPILQYHKPGQLTNSPLVHSGAAIQVEHIGDLPALMDRLKGDENFRMERISAQRKFLKDNLPDDGRSAVERIVEIIDHIAQNTLSKAH